MDGTLTQSAGLSETEPCVHDSPIDDMDRDGQLQGLVLVHGDVPEADQGRCRCAPVALDAG